MFLKNALFTDSLPHRQIPLQDPGAIAQKRIKGTGAQKLSPDV